MDTELFELCKEVHKRTGWENENYNLYTTDYVLDKLPHIISRKNGGFSRYWYPDVCVFQNIDTNEADGWVASYESTKAGEGTLTVKGDEMITFSNTPLKALLKLVIALNDAGELS